MPTYRFRRYQVPNHPTPGYQGTLEVLDEATGAVLASCEMAGRAAQSVLEILAADGTRWTCTPNRRVMPTQWALCAAGRLLFQFDSKVAGKLLNPLYRVSLAVRNPEGVEEFAVVDPRTSLPDRMLGTGPDEWALMREGAPIGRVTSLPRSGDFPKGWLGSLKKFLAGSDPGIASEGDEHVMPAPVALALLAIHRELTNVSG